MNILDLKKINIIVLSMLLFLSMQIPVFASEPVTEVKIPVEQVVEGEAQDQAAEFSYVLTTNQNEAPMPAVCLEHEEKGNCKDYHSDYDRWNLSLPDLSDDRTKSCLRM